jgi:hypothetical protein
VPTADSVPPEDEISAEVNPDRAAADTHRWQRWLSHFLARAGVDRQFANSCQTPAAPLLPSGALEYLQLLNPRLKLLKDGYAAFKCDALESSQWTQTYIDKDLPLLRFRGDCAFVWQHRDANSPASYVLTYYYLRATGYGPLLDKLTEDGLLGAYTLNVDNNLISRDRIDSVCELSFLNRLLEKAPARVLDIGSGYGRLAHRLVQAFPEVSV